MPWSCGHGPPARATPRSSTIAPAAPHPCRRSTASTTWQGRVEVAPRRRARPGGGPQRRLAGRVGPWVVFLDDDVVPAARLVGRPPRGPAAAAAAVCGQPGPDRRAAARPHRRATDWERNVAGLADAWWVDRGHGLPPVGPGWVGGFDERFPRAYREDADLAPPDRRRRLAHHGVSGPLLHPVRPAPWHVSVGKQAGQRRRRADGPAARRRLAATGPEHRAASAGGTCHRGGGHRPGRPRAVGRRRRLAPLCRWRWAGPPIWSRRRIRPGTADPVGGRGDGRDELGAGPRGDGRHLGHGCEPGGWSPRPPPCSRRADGRHAVPSRPCCSTATAPSSSTCPTTATPTGSSPCPAPAPRSTARAEPGCQWPSITNQSGDRPRAARRRRRWTPSTTGSRSCSGPFDVVVVCPHGPDDGCDCRKPATRAWSSGAAAELGVPTRPVRGRRRHRRRRRGGRRRPGPGRSSSRRRDTRPEEMRRRPRVVGRATSTPRSDLLLAGAVVTGRPRARRPSRQRRRRAARRAGGPRRRRRRATGHLPLRTAGAAAAPLLPGRRRGDHLRRAVGRLRRAAGRRAPSVDALVDRIARLALDEAAHPHLVPPEPPARSPCSCGWPGVRRIAAVERRLPGSLLDVRHRRPARRATRSNRRCSSVRRGSASGSRPATTAGWRSAASMPPARPFPGPLRGRAPGRLGARPRPGPPSRPRPLVDGSLADGLAGRRHRSGRASRRSPRRRRRRSASRSSTSAVAPTWPRWPACWPAPPSLVVGNTGPAHLAAAVGHAGRVGLRSGRAGRPLAPVGGPASRAGRPGRRLRRLPGACCPSPASLPRRPCQPSTPSPRPSNGWPLEADPAGSAPWR